MKSLLQGLNMAGTVCCCLCLTVPSGGQTRMTLDEELFAQEPEENNEEKIAE